MNQYLEALEKILIKGKKKTDRTGVGTYSYTRGIQLSFDLQEGYPICTTKRVYWRSVVAELLWFLRGSTSLKELQDMDCHIWDDWAKDGQDDLGPIYGKQWRSWGLADRERMCDDTCGLHSTDQIGTLINSISSNPFSRRHVITAWNPDDVPFAALPPCHILFQFTVEPDEEGNPEFLNCHLYQRSADFFIGVPFNIASYSLLVHMIAKQVGLKPGHFVHSFGDAHIYTNHVDQVLTQLKRTPRHLPTISMLAKPDLKTMTWGTGDPIEFRNFYVAPGNGRHICIDKKHKDGDMRKQMYVVLDSYNPHPFIKAPIAV
jgi:thymidylate synthase